MPYSMEETTLGALLHDVGKLIQRAYGSTEKLPCEQLDMESTLCPLWNGRYTHKHVLFTNAFFDLMERDGLLFPEGLRRRNIEAVASFHHNPEHSPQPEGSWICTLADRMSAGMDRRPDEDRDNTVGSSRDAYRKTPLRCLFDEVILDEEALGKPQRNAYRLEAMDPVDPAVLIPHKWPEKGLDPDLPRRYLEVWESFWTEFKRAAEPNRSISYRVFEEMLLGLLETHAWAIPSSTLDSPDISLFDHSRTTAAIAACLHKYHESRDELGDKFAIQDQETPKFQFLAGDLSGIQNTLFTLESQGVKGVNKILRARSFMMTAITEAAALLALEVFQLPLSCVIQQAGGRFLLLIPALPETDEAVEDLRKKLDQWLLRNYTGSLALNLALSPVFSAAEFKPRALHRVRENLGIAIDEAKFRPLSSCRHGVLPREFPLDAVCSVCGVRPAEQSLQDVLRCSTCGMELELGRRLVRARVIVWGKSLPAKWSPIEVFGLHLAVLDNPPEFVPDGVLSIRRTEPVDPGVPWAQRILANHIPTFKNSNYCCDPRYQWIAQEDEPAKIGDPKTFQHIAAESLELVEGNRVRGRAYLALLKADVDFLGFIFSAGFMRDRRDKDRLSLSRMAQLSRMLDLYFTGYLKGLLHREFADTYTVYAGGDDLLLIGPWRQTMKLACRVQETFQQYTGNNPNITLSAGIALMKPNTPVNRCVNKAERYLDAAKNQGRNKVCALFSKAIPWQRYQERLADADWIHDKLGAPAPPSVSFLYRLLQIARDAEAFTVDGDLRRANWRAHLAYHLSRNIAGRNAAEKERNIVEWLERLGFDNQFKLTAGHPHLYDWRLPLQIALYRNRA